MPSLSLAECYRKALVRAFPPERIYFRESCSTYDDVQGGVAFFSGKTWVEVINDADSFRQHDDLINLLEANEDKLSLLPVFLYVSVVDPEPDTEVYGLIGFLRSQKVEGVFDQEQRAVIVFCLATLVARDGLGHLNILPVLDKFLNPS
jgi:hypothetical protein